MENSFHLKMSFLCCAVALVLVSAAYAEIGIGSAREEVIAEFGKPMGSTKSASKEVMLYSDGKTVELVDGKVTQISGVKGGAIIRQKSPEPPPTPTRAEHPVRKRREQPATAVPGEARVIRQGDLKAAVRLEPEGEGVNARDKYGNTMLHMWPRSMAGGYTAERLVKEGADVNAKNMFGQTPLHMCASENWQPRTDLLLRSGADINAADDYGKTPLHYAELYYQRMMSALLREKGADPSIKDRFGHTASDIRYEHKGWSLTQKGESRESAFRDVCFGNNMFVAVGDYGRIFTSPDGVQWTSRFSDQSQAFSCVDYVNDRFMASVGWGNIAVSTDGAVWTVTELEGPARTQVTGICYNRRIYLAVSSRGEILVSADGKSWETKATGDRIELRGPCAFGNDFYAVDKKGRLYKSRDGNNWEKFDLNVGDLEIEGIASLNGTLFVFGENGLILWSTDGATWTEADPECRVALYDMTCGDDMYVAVGDRGTVLISKDGKNWMARNLHAASESYGICYGNGAFVALTYAGLMTWRPSATVVPPAQDRPGLELREFLDGLTSPEDGVRIVSQRELALMGEAALEPAIAMLRDPQEKEVARKAAINILGRVGGARAAQALSMELTNLSSSVRMDVAQALVLAKDPVSVDALMHVLDTDDYSPELRALCCTALGEIGNPKPIRMLMRKIKTDRDERVQQESYIALDKITGQNHSIDNKARMEWLKKNHPEWLEESTSTFKPERKEYKWLVTAFCVAVVVGFGILFWIWKR